jgi:hypothetical protein
VAALRQSATRLIDQEFNADAAELNDNPADNSNTLRDRCSRSAESVSSFAG